MFVLTNIIPSINGNFEILHLAGVLLFCNGVSVENADVPEALNVRVKRVEKLAAWNPEQTMKGVIFRCGARAWRVMVGDASYEPAFSHLLLILPGVSLGTLNLSEKPALSATCLNLCHKVRKS